MRSFIFPLLAGVLASANSALAFTQEAANIGVLDRQTTTIKPPEYLTNAKRLSRGMKLNPPVRRVPGHHRRHDYASPLPWVPGSGKVRCFSEKWNGYLRATGNATVLGREEDATIVDFTYEQGTGMRPMSNLAMRDPVWQIAPYLAAASYLQARVPESCRLIGTGAAPRDSGPLSLKDIPNTLSLSDRWNQESYSRWFIESTIWSWDASSKSLKADWISSKPSDGKIPMYFFHDTQQVGLSSRPRGDYASSLDCYIAELPYRAK